MINSIGHINEKLKLKDIIKSNAVGHAYLFVGKKSIGKKLVAIEFAKNIMCDIPVEYECCNNCVSCKTFENNSDFKILYPDNGAIKVDMIRELSKEIYLLPTISKKKVFIIDDADTMNEQAQNALLKVLEEPPEYATIILIASNKDKLLNTIKSRVVEFKFDNLKKEEMELIIGKEITNEAYNYSNGSVERVLAFSDNTYYELAKELSELLLEKNFLKINRKFEEIKSDKNLKANISDIIEKVMYIFYGKLKNDDMSTVKFIDELAQVLQNLKKNANVDLALDILMINLCNI